MTVGNARRQLVSAFEHAEGSCCLCWGAVAAKRSKASCGHTEVGVLTLPESVHVLHEQQGLTICWLVFIFDINTIEASWVSVSTVLVYAGQGNLFVWYFSPALLSVTLTQASNSRIGEQGNRGAVFSSGECLIIPPINRAPKK